MAEPEFLGAVGGRLQIEAGPSLREVGHGIGDAEYRGFRMVFHEPEHVAAPWVGLHVLVVVTDETRAQIQVVWSLQEFHLALGNRGRSEYPAFLQDLIQRAQVGN